jgi:uncharacterized protein (DUF885 family)
MTRREWLAAAAAAPLAAQSPDLDRFFQQFLEQWIGAEPEAATAMRLFSGEEQDRLDSQLNDISDAGLHDRVRRARGGLAQLDRFDASRFSARQRISAEVLRWCLTDVIREEPLLDTRYPLNQFGGVQVRLVTLMTDLHPLRTRRNAGNYIARLRAIGGKMDQATAAMQERAAKGIRPPAFILTQTAEQMRRFISPAPENNILVTSFAPRLQKIEGLDPKQIAGLRTEAVSLVRDSVYPAYRRALDGLVTISGKANDDAGLWRLPGGAEVYAFYLHRYTTTEMTPAEVHRKGLDEVTRIEGEMDGLLKKLGYGQGSIKDRMKKLEDDNCYPEAADVRTKVLADYEKIVRDAARRSEEAFLRHPRAMCIVQRIPEFQEANAAANYQAPPPDGSRPGVFRVPLAGPRFSRAGMRTLAYHEAIPGHHFQLALQVEMTSLPQFRRTNPFGPMSAFSEGWGLYAERLASDLGWYREDAVGDLGRLNGELFRARRLVVDTGLHSLKWTRQQAIDYAIEQKEVDRYVVMPGQACSYKIGQLKILELRDQARQALGGKFSLKEYHDVVLGNGSIPLTLLERVVREWIAAKKQS